METVVLSGPFDRASQARAVLQQKGFRVEDSLDPVLSNRGPVAKRDYNHGFDAEPGEGFVTCSGDVEGWQVVEPLGFRLRMHWNAGSEGSWDNPKSRTARDPFKELDDLKGALRGAGITIPGEN